MLFEGELPLMAIMVVRIANVKAIMHVTFFIFKLLMCFVVLLLTALLGEYPYSHARMRCYVKKMIVNRDDY